MAILYNIKKVVLTELDSTTGLPVDGAEALEISTAQKAELEPVLSEGEEDVLRSPEKILAIARTNDLLYGYDVTLTDNTFNEKVAALVGGFKVDEETGNVSTPMTNEGFTGKEFKLDIYVANYEGDAIVNYCKITLNKCIGKCPKMDIGEGFYAPEFEIKARENSKAKLPIQEMVFVDSLTE